MRDICLLEYFLQPPIMIICPIRKQEDRNREEFRVMVIGVFERSKNDFGVQYPISSNISNDEKDSFKKEKMGAKKALRSLKLMSPLILMLLQLNIRIE